MDLDILDRIDKYVGVSSYAWIPILALVLIVCLAALVGWINGWKTSLYFFGWNLVGLISGVLLTETIMNAFSSILVLKTFIIAFPNTANVLMLLFYLISINILAFSFYWIFRKKFKRSMKDNKKSGKSNYFSRFVGAGIAVASTAPSAIFASSTLSIMSNQNWFTKNLDKVMSGFTAGKYKETIHEKLLLKNISQIYDFGLALFNDTAINSGNLEKIENALGIIFKTDFSKNLNKIYDSLFEDYDTFKDELKTISVQNIENNIPQMKIAIEANDEKHLDDALKTLFKDNPNVDIVVSTIINRLKG